jgi:hypothetical protein
MFPDQPYPFLIQSYGFAIIYRERSVQGGSIFSTWFGLGRLHIIIILRNRAVPSRGGITKRVGNNPASGDILSLKNPFPEIPATSIGTHTLNTLIREDPALLFLKRY